MSRTTLKNLNEEIKILSNLPKNDHIIRMHDAIKTKHHFYLVVDFCNGGDLETFLEVRQTISEQEVKAIF